MKCTSVLFGSAAILAAGACVFAAPAYAESSSASGLTEVSRISKTSAECVAKVTAAQESGTTDRIVEECTSSAVLSVSAPQPVTTADAEAEKSSLSPQGFSTLMDAVADGGVQKSEYSQQMNNITDAETQHGTFYYDGNKVWVTDDYNGFKSTHICAVNWNVGYSVDIVDCGDSGSQTQRDVNATWAFGIGIKGSPVGWNETYTIHVGNDGHVWQ